MTGICQWKLSTDSCRASAVVLWLCSVRLWHGLFCIHAGQWPVLPLPMPEYSMSLPVACALLFELGLQVSRSWAAALLQWL